jgi:hypothetical protein
VHVGALPVDAQVPIAIGGVRASIAASAMHPSISLLANFCRALLAAACIITSTTAAEVEAQTMFNHAEDAVIYVKKLDLKDAKSFDLKIADSLLAGNGKDVMGFGMTIIVDAVLSRGFEPDGFVQVDGFRLYHYKKSNP